jgi:AbrB family looped-hinge helix DNA binding protein
MVRAKVSSKFQITLAKEIREALGIKAGDEIHLSKEGDKVVIRAIPKVENPTRILYGSVKGEEDAVKAIREFRKSVDDLHRH